MKIGISGGTGLIGKNLTLRLLEQGFHVRIFTRSSNVPTSFLGRLNLEILRGASPRIKDLEGLDGMINLAGAPIAGVRWSQKVKNEIRDSRVSYTKELVQSISKIAGTPLKFFLQGSAIGYYGSYERESPVFSESSSVGIDYLANLCKDWEDASDEISTMGIRRVKMRTGVVLSLQGGALKSMLPPFRFGIGGPIGFGEQILSWIHLKDLISSILYIIRDPNLSGAFNLVAPNPVSNRIFSETLGKTLNRPAFFRVPASALYGLFGEGADVVLKGQNVIPERLLKAGFSFSYPTIEVALRELLR
ncbi:TIGR01777 family oxidoreductase [Leptospira sp. 201903070]|uniref:TIGR01777 family oxidoreductase n=1 Tax=Leptospira ainlahdjerensis TaxID=2810033 RepID=A0ABS2UFX0_9LEPT|nr:TIGR01777 family oxidoreductase [Leptospira ainlahdjerensis]MBM9579276.1 TIGR01777 family oxidoreductase [Leptospira ainlahdjerensis]